MNIQIKNNYAGNIVGFKIIHGHNDARTIVFEVSGYIETNTQRIIYSGTGHIIINNGYIFIKLPKNTIPTFYSKHFKIWYECKIAFVFEDHLLEYKTPFDIHNHNLLNFNFNEFLIFKPVKSDNLEYYEMKTLISIFLAFNKLNKTPQIISKFTKQSNLEKSLPPGIETELKRISKIKSFDELKKDRFFSDILNRNYSISNKDLFDYSLKDHPANYFTTISIKTFEKLGFSESYSWLNSTDLIQNSNINNYLKDYSRLNSTDLIQNSNINNYLKDKNLINESIDFGNFESISILASKYLKEPLDISFNDFNWFEIENPVKKFSVFKDSKKIATISHKVYFYKDQDIIINFYENVKNTEITIYQINYENGNLIDAEIRIIKKIDTEGAIEKVIDLNITDYTIKTFIFEVKYTMSIYFDGFEVSCDLEILNPSAKIKFSEDLY